MVFSENGDNEAIGDNEADFEYEKARSNGEETGGHTLHHFMCFWKVYPENGVDWKTLEDYRFLEMIKLGKLKWRKWHSEMTLKVVEHLNSDTTEELDASDE